MTATGFYEQKSLRPGGLAVVIALHAAAFTGLALAKTTYERVATPITDIFNIPIPPDPDVEPPPPHPDVPRQQPTVIDAPRPIVPTHTDGPVVTERPIPPLPPTGDIGRETVIADATPDLPRVPVRVEAQFDPRYAGDQQPPYPASEQREQRDGTVRIRLTIGPDGRVRAVEKLSATSDAFWRATERHALAHWRFRPATLDGRPVETTKLMTVFFRIEA